MQLGNGFVTRKYEYVKGAYDSEKFAGKLKSTPETELVEKITFNDGKELRYTYDESGNITTVRNENGALLSAYTYDLLGRLKTEQNVTGQFYTVYNYDNGGNITSKSKYACTATEIVTSATGLTLQNTDTYTYDTVWKDKLISYNGSTITYDGCGNAMVYKGNPLAYTKGRQLKAFGSNAYEYNENGIRISKSVNGVKHTYVLDGIKILREKYSDVTLDFLYGVEEDIVGFTYNNVPYYYRKNLQGDIIGIVDSNGELIATYEYNAWGKLLSVTGNTLLADINPIRYRSYYYDTETQLYYLNSRYYDPDTCRFINADDAGYIGVDGKIGTYNLFSYCGNNPIQEKDISGCFALKNLWDALKNCFDFLHSIVKDMTAQYFPDLRNREKIDKIDSINYKPDEIKKLRKATGQSSKKLKKELEKSISKAKKQFKRFKTIGNILTIISAVFTVISLYNTVKGDKDVISVVCAVLIELFVDLFSSIISKLLSLVLKFVPFVGFLLGWLGGWLFSFLIGLYFTKKRKKKMKSKYETIVKKTNKWSVWITGLFQVVLP